VGGSESAPAPPGWRRRDIEDLPWPVLIRVAVCRGVLCMLITLLVVAFLPRPFGFVGSTIVTGSMMPRIQPGDVALVNPLDEYLPGQVILFPNPSNPEQQIMHRIVEIRDDGMYLTKGDANEFRDSTPVNPGTVIGVGRILVPAIGLPIVWAAGGDVLLVIAVVLLGGLLIRGALSIEFFPGTRKGRVTRTVIESTAMLAMLGVAAVVIVVGTARSSYASFMDRSTVGASWAMAGPGPTPTPAPTVEPAPECSITDWQYTTWGDPYNGFLGKANFIVWNNTEQRIPDEWTLTWDFTSDEIATGSPFASSITQVGTAVTFVAMDWLYLPPMSPSSVIPEITLKSTSGVFLAPTNFVINGTMACEFEPVSAEQLEVIIPAPTPSAVVTPSP